VRDITSTGFGLLGSIPKNPPPQTATFLRHEQLLLGRIIGPNYGHCILFLQVVEQKEPHSSASTSGNSLKKLNLKKLQPFNLIKEE
jgi:hypothetical protein